jgi:hypothetical protein
MSAQQRLSVDSQGTLIYQNRFRGPTSKEMWRSAPDHLGRIPLRKERFLILLIALLLLFVLRPLLLELGSRVIILDLLMIILFLSCINAVSDKRRSIYTASILLALSLAARILAEFRWHETLETIFYALNDVFLLLFLLYACILILSYVLTGSEVTRDRIAAAICVFLLLGLIFGAGHRLIYELDPGSYHLGDGATAFSVEERNPEDFIYFSYVTLTTLGYGDITPKSSSARYLATLEAIIGQLYIAVLIARMVGVYIAQDTRKK